MLGCLSSGSTLALGGGVGARRRLRSDGGDLFSGDFGASGDDSGSRRYHEGEREGNEGVGQEGGLHFCGLFWWLGWGLVKMGIRQIRCR